MSNRKFFTALIAGGALFWALLQGTVSATYARPRPEPVSYRATIGVGVVAEAPIDVYTIPPEGGG